MTFPPEFWEIFGKYWGVISRKFAHKFAKSKYFEKIKNKSESPDGSF